MWPFTEPYPERCAEEVNGKTFDYIIVGGGTAGCVLASRLSEDPAVSVLVIERGFVKDSWASRVPLISMNYLAADSQAITDRYSVPVAARGGYKLRLISGAALGGSSRVNAAIATRGTPGGYNAWAESLGLADWSWDKVEPYFRWLETAVSAPKDASRGHQGMFEVRTAPESQIWYSYLEKPCQSLGLPVCRDINSSKAPAQGYFNLDVAIDLQGKRVSSFSAFLNKDVAKQRKDRLVVCTGTIATKLEMDKANVTGVHIRTIGKTSNYFVAARREVIVCSGAFGTPQLLLLSGIGPSDELKRHDIPQVHNLPVGRHLKDHTSFAIMLEVPWSESILLMYKIFGAIWQFILYLLFGTGVLGNNVGPRAVFLRTSSLNDSHVVKMAEDDGSDNMDAALPRNTPDVEIMMLPCSAVDRIVRNKSLITFFTCLVQPASEGFMELASADVEDHPRVSYPYFSDGRDLITARKAARFSMRLADEFIENSDYPYPTSLFMGPTVNNEDDGRDSKSAKPDPSTMTVPPQSLVQKMWDTITDEEIDAYVLAVGMPSLHYSSTCRMSLDPKQGVVDQRLRVHGIHNLRIADTSVFPKLPSAHTMLPAMMLGARCADFIKTEWKDKKEL